MNLQNTILERRDWRTGLESILEYFMSKAYSYIDEISDQQHVVNRAPDAHL